MTLQNIFWCVIFFHITLTKKRNFNFQILLGNEFDVNVGLKKKRKREVQERQFLSFLLKCQCAHTFLHQNQSIQKQKRCIHFLHFSIVIHISFKSFFFLIKSKVYSWFVIWLYAIYAVTVFSFYLFISTYLLQVYFTSYNLRLNHFLNSLIPYANFFKMRQKNTNNPPIAFFILYAWRILKKFTYCSRYLRKWLSRKLYEV